VANEALQGWGPPGAGRPTSHGGAESKSLAGLCTNAAAVATLCLNAATLRLAAVATLRLASQLLELK
jgi:hypothetical protein